MKSDGLWPLFCVGLVIGAIAGFTFGANIGMKSIQKIAIEQNVARYTCNPVTGKRTFQWGYGCFTNVENKVSNITVIEK